MRWEGNFIKLPGPAFPGHFTDLLSLQWIDMDEWEKKLKRDGFV